MKAAASTLRNARPAIPSGFSASRYTISGNEIYSLQALIARVRAGLKVRCATAPYLEQFRRAGHSSAIRSRTLGYAALRWATREQFRRQFLSLRQRLAGALSSIYKASKPSAPMLHQYTVSRWNIAVAVQTTPVVASSAGLTEISRGTPKHQALR